MSTLSPERDSQQKGRSCLSEILKENCKRCQDFFKLRGWLKFFPLRGTNSKTTHYLLSHFCRLNILKGIEEALRGTKPAF